MKAHFTELRWENPLQTIATLSFRPDRPYYYTAGQYADISVPHDNPDSRGMTRTMTLTSLPSDKQVSFTARFWPKANSSYKDALLNLQPGDIVSITDSMGDLVLPLDSNTPLVFVAGGIGIASYVSMVKWLTEQNDAREITLLYAVRDVSDIIFLEEFDKYNSVGKCTRVLYTTDNKSSSITWPGTIKPSRLTSTEIMRFVNDDSQIYISGAEQMVDQLQLELQKEHNVPQYRIAFDFFDGYTEL